ncbi:MAG TPA: FtsQ-type POTRA domain-containing protein, partial [Acidimicrobiales bacterium]
MRPARPARPAPRWPAWLALGPAGAADGSDPFLDYGADRVPAEEAEGPPAGRSRPRIDPRFARRWSEVRREQGRRRLRILVGVGSALLVAVVGIGSLYSPLLSMRHVRIATVGGVSRAEILAVTGLAHRRPLVDVNAGELAARLDAVPALGGAVVRRSWPTTVTVRVTLRTAVAVVGRPAGRPAAGPGAGPASGSAGWATVDATGRVLADVTTPIVGLPVLVGFGSVPAPGGWLEGTAGPRAAPPGPAGGPALANLNAASDSPSVPGGPAAALAVATALPTALRSDVQSITV